MVWQIPGQGSNQALSLLILLCLCWSAAVCAAVKVDVQIDGIEGELLDNARAYLELEQKKGDPELTEGQLRYLYKVGKEEIAKALQPFGYFRVSVEGELRQANGGWVARYSVDPGPRVHVVELDLKLLGEGSSESQLQAAVAGFPLQEGDVLDSAAYEKGKEELLSLADTLGYPRTRMTIHRVRVDPVQGQASIHLHIDTGDRFHLGEIRLHQDILDPDLARRYVRVEPGVRYSQEILLSLQQAFVVTDYFSLVDVRPRFDQVEGDRVPVDVEMTPAKRHRLSFGLGYDTDIGPNASVRWKNRLINRYGHQSENLLKVSEVESTLRYGYWIPVNDPRTDRLAFSGLLRHEDTKTSKSNSVELTGGYLSRWRTWSSRLFTEFLYERFAAGKDPKKRTMLLSLGSSLERTRVDDSRFPTQGNYWFMQVKGSSGVISDTAYLRGRIKTKYLFPVGERGRFNVRGELGLATVADFDQYPSTLRFFTGGDQSIRGYDYKSLGPKGKDKEVVGGRNVVTASIQYDRRVLDDWVAAVFVDAGNAFDSSSDKIYYGSGVGLHWLSPFGSVRVDVAWPLNRKDDSPRFKEWRLHVGFGTVL
jgi:translocation and assembly module TamA